MRIVKEAIFEYSLADANLIDLADDITSEWLSLDEHPNRFNHAELVFNWDGVDSATKDGVIYIETTNYKGALDENDDLPEGAAITIEHTIDVDSESTEGDAIAITLDNGYRRRLRFRYEANAVDNGDMSVLIELFAKE